MNYKVHDNEIIYISLILILTKLSTAVRHFDGKKCRASMTVHIPAIFSTVR